MYKGDWKNGTPHGFGQSTDPAGSVYIGQRELRFPYSWSSWSRYLTLVFLPGDFVEGVPHGRGSHRWVHGEVYEGEYQRGKQQGSVHDNWENTLHVRLIVPCSWLISKGNEHFLFFLIRYGKWTHPSGDCYEGFFDGDRRHGQGTYTTAQGKTWFGKSTDRGYDDSIRPARRNGAPCLHGGNSHSTPVCRQCDSFPFLSGNLGEWRQGKQYRALDRYGEVIRPKWADCFARGEGLYGDAYPQPHPDGVYGVPTQYPAGPGRFNATAFDMQQRGYDVVHAPGTRQAAYDVVQGGDGQTYDTVGDASGGTSGEDYDVVKAPSTDAPRSGSMAGRPLPRRPPPS